MARSMSRILAPVLAPFGQSGTICPLCCSPRPMAPWLILEGDEEPARCPECGLPVDRFGRSVVSPGEHGRPVVRSIRLVETVEA